MALEHHERINGTGYPRGLLGPAIAIEARIVAVADVVAAMTGDRPYRRALKLPAAVTEIRDNSGILYEPSVVEACIAALRRHGLNRPGD